MLTLFRDSATEALPLTPKPAPGPDYAGLVDILIDLQPPDNVGEITITPEEATRIRDACWSARAGAWRAPLIPWLFIAPNRSLWILDDAIDPASRSVPWSPERAVYRRLGPVDPLSALDHQLLGLLRSARTAASPDGNSNRASPVASPRACLTTASANSRMRALSPPPPMGGFTHST